MSEVTDRDRQTKLGRNRRAEADTRVESNACAAARVARGDDPAGVQIGRAAAKALTGVLCPNQRAGLYSSNTTSSTFVVEPMVATSARTSAHGRPPSPAPTRGKPMR